MQVITLAILLLLVPRIAEGQRRSGSGISGGFGSASSVDFIRIHWGPPDSIQLVAAILFRGSTEWGALNPQDSDWAHRAADSARIAAESRGNQAGGTITPRATAWVEGPRSQVGPKSQLRLCSVRLRWALVVQTAANCSPQILSQGL